jgi:hypothetical protein
MKRRPAMKKISTVRVNGNLIFKGHKLTISVDLGDRWSCYCGRKRKTDLTLTGLLMEGIK